MIPFFNFFIAPLVAAALTLWAAWLALAAEADADLPRSLSGQLGHSDAEGGTLSRDLHVAHLALLVLAGAAAGVAVAWWACSPAVGLMRLFLAVGLVWIFGDLVPRLLAAVAPELTLPARRAAVATLVPFQPLLRLAGWADARARARAPVQTTRQAGAAQRDMLLGVFALADTTVAEVMTPRIDIVAVDSAAEREEVVKTLQSSEHARLLVYDGHPDAVAGVIYAKDILALGPTDDPALANADPARGVRARGQDARPAAARLPARPEPPGGGGGRVRRHGRASSPWRTSWSRSSVRSRTSTTPTRSHRSR